MIERLARFVGQEYDVDESARALYAAASDLGAPVVGAMLVTCADEAEIEVVEAFRRQVDNPLLPSLKLGARSHLRLANLGGRYEWGAAAIADDHYSTAAAARGFKAMVFKINAHVSVEATGRGPRFGKMQRYDRESTYCGALHALLDGHRAPFAADLEEALTGDGIDRLEALRDPEQVRPELRGLFAAVASARVQARRALIEMQDRRPLTPTLGVVLPCVTLNRARKDTEILCGVYSADWRSEEPSFAYRGLGDCPGSYRAGDAFGRLTIEDDSMERSRSARDHRTLVLEQWREARESAPGPPAVGGDPAVAEAHVRLEQALTESDRGKHRDLRHSLPLLKLMLSGLALLDPVTAALVLFSEGAASVHHLYRAHRLSRRLGDHTQAHRILDDVRERVDALDPEHAARVIDVLAREHRRA